MQDSLQMPVGWADFTFRWTTIPGWLLAGVALMQGAPFWFDLLHRAVAFRRSRKPDDA